MIMSHGWGVLYSDKQWSDFEYHTVLLSAVGFLWYRPLFGLEKLFYLSSKSIEKHRSRVS